MGLESKHAAPYVAACIVAAASVVLALVGCSSSAPAESESESESPDPRPQPVLDGDFPDPDVLRVGDTYYAYATNNDTSNVQVATSTDLTSWQRQDDAMPDLPSWIEPGNTWAPEVTEVTPGNFVIYFTAANVFPARQCIGVATSTDPAGPFQVQGDGMLLCPVDEGGAIDASTFVDDDGSLHLVWKNDGNCCGLDTWIQTAPLSPDGLAIAGPTRKLIKQTLDWEGELVVLPRDVS